ncbi:MAG: TatD family hydrolase [Bacteroidota bacterium]|nr:TatD family hydrolase [Bacteroidota bacterium]
MIDTHVHLYSDQFEPDLAEVIKRAKQAGISKCLMPNIDRDSVTGMMQIVTDYPDYCYPMMGLHPTDVKDNYKAELDYLYSQIIPISPIAIGEIGLDYYWDKLLIPQQKDAFATQIEWAQQLKLPIAIHTRDSIDDGIEMVTLAYAKKAFTGVFHCFSGNLDQAKQILELDNFYLGIGGVVTFKNGGLDKFIHKIPLARVLLETDAPYLTPAPNRGKRNEPAMLNYVVEKLAILYSVSMHEIMQITTKNAEALFFGNK